MRSRVDGSSGRDNCIFHLSSRMEPGTGKKKGRAKRGMNGPSRVIERSKLVWSEPRKRGTYPAIHFLSMILSLLN